MILVFRVWRWPNISHHSGKRPANRQAATISRQIKACIIDRLSVTRNKWRRDWGLAACRVEPLKHGHRLVVILACCDLICMGSITIHHGSMKILSIVILIAWYQCSWGLYGANLGSTGPRWAKCWLHESCYPGSVIFLSMVCIFKFSLSFEAVYTWFKTIQLQMHKNQCNSWGIRMQ